MLFIASYRKKKASKKGLAPFSWRLSVVIHSRLRRVQSDELIGQQSEDHISTQG